MEKGKIYEIENIEIRGAGLEIVVELKANIRPGVKKMMQIKKTL